MMADQDGMNEAFNPIGLVYGLAFWVGFIICFISLLFFSLHAAAGIVAWLAGAALIVFSASTTLKQVREGGQGAFPILNLILKIFFMLLALGIFVIGLMSSIS
ncbi:MAG: hypothetical protein ABIC95_04120 [archaeon]